MSTDAQLESWARFAPENLPPPYRGDVFDPSRMYRYRLWRKWSETGGRCLFVMLNPSKATATVKDSTITKCIGFAQRWGYGSFEVVNIFALVSTDPRVLYKTIDPVGPSNDLHIAQSIADANHVVVAWGQHGSHMKRGEAVLRLIRKSKDPYAFRLTKSGEPYHPLYQPDRLVPRSMEELWKERSQ